MVNKEGYHKRSRKHTLCTRVPNSCSTLLHDISHLVSGSMLDYLIDHPETVGIDMELPLWASQVEFYTVWRRESHPDFLSIPDPGSNISDKRGCEKIFFCSTFSL